MRDVDLLRIFVNSLRRSFTNRRLPGIDLHNHTPGTKQPSLALDT